MRKNFVTVIAAGALLVVAGGAMAQSNMAAFSTAEPDIRPGQVPFEEPEVLQSSNGRLAIELDVIMHEEGGEIYRSYAKPGTKDILVPGPTWSIKPGDLVTLKLNNIMPNHAPDEKPLPPSDRPNATMNGPHGFNITNMHTHGLWVSPSGNSDNVLNRVQPQTSFEYEYVLPKEHWAGTMWYHPHNHGSTAAQVAAGMAGALIIQGGLDAMPGMPTGDDDRVMILQQILGSKRVAKIVGLMADIDSVLDPSTVHTTVNALWRPTIALTENKIQRLRFINAASHDNMVLQIADYDPRNPESRDNLLNLYPISFDGIAATGTVRAHKTIMLAPGNRVDLLVNFPAGPPNRAYAIWSLDDKSQFNKITVDELIGYVTIASPKAAAGSIPVRIPDSYGPIPHLITTGTPMDVNRQVLFSAPASASGGVNFFVDNHPFESQVINQTVYEGAVEEWTISNDSIGVHPFHIHVNPFKLTDFTATGLEYEDVYGGYLPAYYAMCKDRYIDTLLIPPQPAPKPGRPTALPGFFKMQSRFERFVGTYVLHCHILSHEDAGMMQLVEVIANPGDLGTRIGH